MHGKTQTVGYHYINESEQSRPMYGIQLQELFPRWKGRIHTWSALKRRYDNWSALINHYIPIILLFISHYSCTPVFVLYCLF